jgi:hypothetical protein
VETLADQRLHLLASTIEELEAATSRATIVYDEILGGVNTSHANKWDVKGPIAGIFQIELVHRNINTAAF